MSNEVLALILGSEGYEDVFVSVDSGILIVTNCKDEKMSTYTLSEGINFLLFSIILYRAPF